MLVDEDFINYVMNPTRKLTDSWENYFRLHPDQIPLAEEARQILFGVVENKTLPAQEALELKARIFEKCGLTVSN